MINLVRAELLRLLRRRVTLFAGIALLAVVALFALVVNVTTTPPSAAATAEGRASFAQDHRDWEANHVQSVKECVDEQSGTQEQCESFNPEPTLDNYVSQPSTYAEAAGLAVQYGSVLALMVLFFVGASFVGAEYGSGAIANWLTFVPERLKVLGSKLIAMTLVAALAMAVVNALSMAVAAVIVKLHDGAVTGVGTVAEVGGRSVVLAVVAALVGLCLALLTRHTVAALGILLGYLVLSGVLTVLTNFIPVFSKLPPWLPQPNVSAFQEHGGQYYELPPTSANPQEAAEPILKLITFTHASVYLAVLLVVVLGVSGWVFRRRDVT